MIVYAPLSPSSRRAWVEIRVRAAALLRAGSPSSRRAWVEIIPLTSIVLTLAVALLAEGVGRNLAFNTSLLRGELVALLAEGVGRNHLGYGSQSPLEGRPPRGGRG